MTGENNLGRDLASIDAFYKKNPELNVKAPMTETHSLGDWEEEFDEKFPLKYSSEPKPLMISCTEHHAPASPTELKNFIRSLLLAQKEGFRREIEYMKNGVKHTHMGGCFDCSKDEVLNKLLTKLDTNGI